MEVKILSFDIFKYIKRYNCPIFNRIFPDPFISSALSKCEILPIKGSWRIWGLEGMRALSPRRYYKTIERTCPKLSWNWCIGNVIRKVKIIEELEIKINKNLISIFNGFLWVWLSQSLAKRVSKFNTKF